MKKYQQAMQVAKDFPDFATGPESLSDPGRRECSRLADELWPETPSAANTLIDYMHTARWVLANNPALAGDVLAGRVPLTDARRQVALANDAGCEPVSSQTTPKADAPKCSQCGEAVSGNVSGNVTCGRCAMQAADRRNPDGPMGPTLADWQAPVPEGRQRVGWFRGRALLHDEEFKAAKRAIFRERGKPIPAEYAPEDSEIAAGLDWDCDPNIRPLLPEQRFSDSEPEGETEQEPEVVGFEYDDLNLRPVELRVVVGMPYSEVKAHGRKLRRAVKRSGVEGVAAAAQVSPATVEGWLAEADRRQKLERANTRRRKREAA